jgi:hypothetical protein
VIGWQREHRSLDEGLLWFGGCMLWDGLAYAYKIDRRMERGLYIKIMKEDLQASLKYYDKDTQASDVIFQQVNDPKHTCQKAQKWFKVYKLDVMTWPA